MRDCPRSVEQGDLTRQQMLGIPVKPRAVVMRILTNVDRYILLIQLSWNWSVRVLYQIIIVNAA